jgi:glycerophosphoryl diester phosphodiesterase
MHLWLAAFTIVAFTLVSSTFAQAPEVELVGYAELPADTFAEGPASGEFTGAGGKEAAARFEGQPVQGFSGIQFGEDGSYWLLSDNGFGSKYNSIDYQLRINNLTLEPKTSDGGEGTITLNNAIILSDPDKHIPFYIVNEFTPERILTGFDFDIESFVVANDGTLWIGDEFGPFLLHVDATGKVLEPPFSTPDFAEGKNPEEDFVQSPQNPALMANVPNPGEPSPATLKRSQGFEGMAMSPDKTKLYPMLEGTVVGDPEGTARIYEFDVATKAYTGIVGLYQFEDPANAIGDFAVINDSEFLVIERDGASGAEAKTKHVYKIALSQQDENGIVEKALVADLLQISDPNNLAPSTQEGVFSFPFVTIEDVLVLDANTILVANDNNYPGTGGRGEELKDNNEFIWLRLATPLSLAEGVGQAQ